MLWVGVAGSIRPCSVHRTMPESIAAVIARMVAISGRPASAAGSLAPIGAPHTATMPTRSAAAGSCDASVVSWMSTRSASAGTAVASSRPAASASSRRCTCNGLPPAAPSVATSAAVGWRPRRVSATCRTAASSSGATLMCRTHRSAPSMLNRSRRASGRHDSTTRTARSWPVAPRRPSPASDSASASCTCHRPSRRRAVRACCSTCSSTRGRSGCVGSRASNRRHRPAHSTVGAGTVRSPWPDRPRSGSAEIGRHAAEQCRAPEPRGGATAAC